MVRIARPAMRPPDPFFFFGSSCCIATGRRLAGVVADGTLALTAWTAGEGPADGGVELSLGTPLDADGTPCALGALDAFAVGFAFALAAALGSMEGGADLDAGGGALVLAPVLAAAAVAAFAAA